MRGRRGGVDRGTLLRVGQVRAASSPDLMASHEPMALVTAGLRYLEVNATWTSKVAGESCGPGSSLLDHTVEEDRRPLEAAVDEALCSGHAVRAHRRARRSDGSVFPTETKIVPLPGGGPNLFVGIEDLSPTVAGGVIPRDLVLSQPVAALVLDRTGQCVAVNDSMLRG